MEVSGLKALVKQVEEQRKEFNTKFTEQEKDFNKKLTDFKTDLKKEQKKEMDEKIQKLTNDIAILTAKVCIAIPMNDLVINCELWKSTNRRLPRVTMVLAQQYG